MENRGTRLKTKVNKGKVGERRPPIQIRLPTVLFDKVDDVAEKTGRTRHELIVSAIRTTYLEVPKPAEDLPNALVYGWSNPGEAKALGDALGMLVGRIEDNGPGPGQRELDPADKLAMFKAAIVWVLDQLGASANLSAEQTAFAEMAARQVINNFHHVGTDPRAYSQRADLQVMAELRRCEWPGTKTDDPNRKE